jgi:hypothetical protein
MNLSKIRFAKSKPFLSILALLAASTVVAQTESQISSDKTVSAQSFKSWVITPDSDRKSYEFKLDDSVYRSATKSASISSVRADAGVQLIRRGALMQTIKADVYRGKRMRLSAFVKSENAEQAALWFRIDGEGMQRLGFDGMENRLIKGSSDWSKYEMILDVPVAAQQIVIGAILKGAGQIWVDDFKFEEVGRDVPITSLKPQEEEAKGSLRYIEIYREKNKDAYEQQLRAFQERNKSAAPVPGNLDFESF